MRLCLKSEGDSLAARMATGYVFLEVAPPDERDDGSLAFLAGELRMDISSARELRDVAYHCPPDVLRQLLADSGIRITYSLLREGVRRRLSGVIRDPDWKTLLAAIQTVQQQGGHGVTVTQYRAALGLAAAGPSKLPQDIEEATDDRAVRNRAVERAIADPDERRNLIAQLVQQDELREQIAEAVAAAKTADDEKRRGSRERLTREERRERDGARLAAAVAEIAGSLSALPQRFPKPVTLSANGVALINEALADMGQAVLWIKGKTDAHAPAVIRQRTAQEAKS